MEEHETDLPPDVDNPNVEPEALGARYWYEQYQKQRQESEQLRQQLSQLQSEVEQLKSN
jgi:transposase